MKPKQTGIQRTLELERNWNSQITGARTQLNPKLEPEHNWNSQNLSLNNTESAKLEPGKMRRLLKERPVGCFSHARIEQKLICGFPTELIPPSLN
ncbi:hypothetical protein TNCT_236661 [Trichonephila clavata]|uniref:Uncharacterized protein n=1 Tax=Trichonephila clavata TaxID=2740835 RepID=A0A8X6M7A5_TRICU|nr:hypothetical protein TNCT_236661 [Trichonephila clavata]